MSEYTTTKSTDTGSQTVVDAIMNYEVALIQTWDVLRFELKTLLMVIRFLQWLVTQLWRYDELASYDELAPFVVDIAMSPSLQRKLSSLVRHLRDATGVAVSRRGRCHYRNDNFWSKWIQYLAMCMTLEAHIITFSHRYRWLVCCT